MIIQKSFDVKIRIVYPHLTKNIPKQDTDKITVNTLLKYEPQKAINTYNALEPVAEEKKDESNLDKLTKDFQEVIKEFENIEKIADSRLKNIQHEYDLQDQNNTPVIEAQEYLFGEATGIVTYEQYKQASELLALTQNEMARRAKEKKNVA